MLCWCPPYCFPNFQLRENKLLLSRLDSNCCNLNSTLCSPYPSLGTPVPPPCRPPAAHSGRYPGEGWLLPGRGGDSLVGYGSKPRAVRQPPGPPTGEPHPGEAIHRGPGQGATGRVRGRVGPSRDVSRDRVVEGEPVAVPGPCPLPPPPPRIPGHHPAREYISREGLPTGGEGVYTAGCPYPGIPWGSIHGVLPVPPRLQPGEHLTDTP